MCLSSGENFVTTYIENIEGKMKYGENDNETR